MKSLVFLAVLVLAGAAQSQTVWRCGADGRSYSDSPCATGRVVAVADTRSAADVAVAQDIAEREQTLARELAMQRQEREAQLPLMAGIRHERPAELKTTSKKRSAKKSATRLSKQPSQPPAAHGTWRATAPQTRQTPG